MSAFGPGAQRDGTHAKPNTERINGATTGVRKLSPGCNRNIKGERYYIVKRERRIRSSRNRQLVYGVLEDELLRTERLE